MANTQAHLSEGPICVSKPQLWLLVNLIQDISYSQEVYQWCVCMNEHWE